MGMKLLNYLGIFGSRREIGGGGIDENTVLMLHLNNNVTDVSTGGVNSPHTINNTGVTFSSGTKKWGSHSAYFNGSSAYLSSADSVDWDILADYTEDWTIDLWVKHTDHEGVETYIGSRVAPSSAPYWRLVHYHGSNLQMEAIYPLVGDEITDTNWHHIAWVKKGGVSDAEYGLYQDGVQTAYLQSSTTFTGHDAFAIGAFMTDGYVYFHFFAGYMDEIRIQKSNIFEASPNVGLTDTIDIPTGEYETG